MSYLKQLMDGFMTVKERRNVIIFFLRQSRSWRTWEQRPAVRSEQKFYEPEAPPMLSTCICFCFGLDCSVCVWMKALKAVRTRKNVSTWFPYIQYLHEYMKPRAKRAHSWPEAHLLLTNQPAVWRVNIVLQQVAAGHFAEIMRCWKQRGGACVNGSVHTWSGRDVNRERGVARGLGLKVGPVRLVLMVPSGAAGSGYSRLKTWHVVYSAKSSWGPELMF